MKRWTVRWGQVPGAPWWAWLVRDPDGDLVSAHQLHSHAIDYATRFASTPEPSTGAYL